MVMRGRGSSGSKKGWWSKMVGGEATQPSPPPAAVRVIDTSLPKELELQGLEVQRLGMRVRQLASAQQYAEALQVAEQRLTLSEQTYGPEHPMSATCLNDVGTFVQATPNPNLSSRSLSLSLTLSLL